MAWKSISSLRMLILVLALTSILPGVALTVFNAQKDRRNRIAEVGNEVSALATSITIEEQRTVQEAKLFLTQLAQSRRLWDRTNCSPFLQATLQRYNQYSSLGVADLDGHIYCRGTPLTLGPINVADQLYFQKAIQSSECSVGGVANGRSSGIPVIHLACPIVPEGGKPQAVVILSLLMSRVYHANTIPPIISSIRDYTVTIVNLNGFVLAHRSIDKKWVLGNEASEPRIPEDILGEPFRVRRSVGPGGVSYLNISAPISPIEGTKGYVILGIPDGPLYGEISDRFWRTIGTLLLVSIVGVILAVISANTYVIRPVNALSQAAKRVSQGEYTTRTGVSYNSAELGQLAETFDLMAQQLAQRASERIASETQFRGILESAPDAMVITDRTGQIVMVNKQTENIFQYTRAELIGQEVEMLIPRRVRPGHERERKKIYDKPTVRVMGKGIELEGRRKDATTFPIEITLSPLDTNAGDWAVSAIRDVTVQRQLERSLKVTASQLRNLASHLQTVREEERIRIAREIHDELGQALSGLKLDLHSIDRKLPKEETALSEAMQSCLKQIDEIITDIQSVSAELRPAALDLGLLSAVEWQAEQIQSRTGIHCELNLPATEIIMDHQRSLAAFRIIQEALTNIARHSGADQAVIVLKQEDKILFLEIRDNGKGLVESEASAAQSLGITGMRERTIFLGGSFDIQGIPERGTVVRARFPLSR